MQKKWLVPVLATLVSSLSLAAMMDFSQYGYPDVVAMLKIAPQQHARLDLGGAILNIPSGAFGKDEVKLEVLQGNATTWQAQAPAGQKVLYAFALRVTDLKTNEAVTAFRHPLEFSYDSAQVTNNAQILTTSAATPAKVATETAKPKVHEYTLAKKFHTGILTHSISGASIGWLVAVPSKS